MPPARETSGPCEICCQPGHGRHFGVVSCRACAAFFRRAAGRHYAQRLELVKNGRPLKTRINKICLIGNCKIYENGKFYCKKCRLKKCYDKGMNPGRFQMDRDPLSSTQNFMEAPKSVANFLGRPEFILCCEPDKISHVKTIIDVSWLIEKARNIFKNTTFYSQILPYNFENSLEKVAHEMTSFKKSEPMHTLKKVGKLESLLVWEQGFLGAANWLASFPEFMELDLQVKMDILKSCWLSWVRLGKLYETAYHQKSKVLDENFIVCTDSTCLDVQDFEIDLKWCTNYSMEQMAFFIMPNSDQDWKSCITDLITLNPTHVELNFMLIQLCLHDAGTRNQGKILEATEKLIQIQADNLHDYYTDKLKMPRYSERLQKLLKINKGIELDSRIRRERNQIAQVFDIFSIDFSHPEMFELK